MAWWGWRLATAGLLGLAISGCSQTPYPLADSPRTASLLFARDGTGTLSTQIGRSPWPATTNGVESVQESVFVEYYRDYFGHEFNERNTPQRQFRSYRIGTTQR
jgi:hypothetical protein